MAGTNVNQTQHKKPAGKKLFTPLFSGSMMPLIFWCRVRRTWSAQRQA